MTIFQTLCRRWLAPWLFSVEGLLFTTLIVLHLAPIWAFPYFPSQDGPNHLYSANLLRIYHQHASELFRQFYSVNSFPDPNWFGHLTLAGLLTFLPPLLAEKVFLSGYVILLPLALRYAARSGGQRCGLMALLAFPFIYHRMFFLGFANFSYSLAILFLLLGFWLRRDEGFSRRDLMILGLLGLLLYFCHVVALIMALVAMGIWTAWRAGYAAFQAGKAGEGRREREQGRRARGIIVSTLGRPLLALLPALTLVALYFVKQTLAGPNDGPLIVTGLWKLTRFAMLYYPLVSFRIEELPYATALGGVVLIAALINLGWRLWRRQAGVELGLFLASLAWLAVYLIAPAAGSGGTYIFHRLSIFPFLGLIVWFGHQPPPRLLRLVLLTSAVALGLVLLAMQTAKCRELNGYMKEYASAEAYLQPGSIVLPLCLSPSGLGPQGAYLSIATQPFIHASGLLAARTRCLDLSDYEGTTNYFPLVFHRQVDPAAWLGDFERGIERMDIATYALRIGRLVDYVLVWDDARRILQRPAMREVRRQLERDYALIFISQPRGLMRVYRHK